MENWSKISSSLAGLNLGQSAKTIAKGFNSNVQAAKERLGQVSADEITELPQGILLFFSQLSVLNRCSEYKDLEARVDALRQAHIALLKYVRFVSQITITHKIEQDHPSL